MDYEQDLLADFMRFFPQYGIEPLEVMSGPTFFSLAPRVAAYGGVMACRFQELLADAPAAASVPAGEKVVDLAAFRVEHPGLIEVVSVGG